MPFGATAMPVGAVPTLIGVSAVLVDSVTGMTTLAALLVR